MEDAGKIYFSYSTEYHYFVQFKISAQTYLTPLSQLLVIIIYPPPPPHLSPPLPNPPPPHPEGVYMFVI